MHANFIIIINLWISTHFPEYEWGQIKKNNNFAVIVEILLFVHGFARPIFT